MALKFSQGVVNNVAMGMGWGEVLKNMTCVVYSGTQPATPETAATAGTELVRFTSSGGALTAETRAACKVVVDTTAGTVDSIIVGGVTITAGAITCGTNATTNRDAIIAAINNYYTYPEFYAVAGGTTVGSVTYGAANAGELYILAPKNVGTGFNSATITINTTTTNIALNGSVSKQDPSGAFAAVSGDSASGFTAGVAAVNGLAMTYPAVAGAITKAGTWSGTSSAAGTAGWFRLLCTPNYDTGLTNLSTTTDDAKLILRVDGTIGTSGADMIVSNTSIANAVSQTASTFTFTVPSA